MYEPILSYMCICVGMYSLIDSIYFSKKKPHYPMISLSIIYIILGTFGLVYWGGYEHGYLLLCVFIAMVGFPIGNAIEDIIDKKKAP